MNRQRQILVADDDRAFRETVGEILTQAGYKVRFAEDGKSVVEKVQHYRPDLVLMDGLMPRLHGFLACEAIKKLDAPPKVILLTGVYTKPTYKGNVKTQHGADDLLVKPLSSADLLACIEKHLFGLTRAKAIEQLPASKTHRTEGTASGNNESRKQSA